MEEAAARRVPTTEEMTNLYRQLGEVTSLIATVDQLEADLKAAKAELHRLRADVIPDYMAQIAISELTWNGFNVTVDDFVSGSLPKGGKERAEAIKWLEDHDAGGLITTDVSVKFPRSQHLEAVKIANRLKKDGFAPSLQSTVHAQTLQAYARERMRNGESVPQLTLGLYIGKVAKIKPVESKK